MTLLNELDVEEINQLGVAIMGPKNFSEWLVTKNSILGDRIPESLLTDSKGIAAVKHLLVYQLETQGYKL